VISFRKDPQKKTDVLFCESLFRPIFRKLNAQQFFFSSKSLRNPKAFKSSENSGNFVPSTWDIPASKEFFEFANRFSSDQQEEK
jgi:hypothetical protein